MTWRKVRQSGVLRLSKALCGLVSNPMGPAASEFGVVLVVGLKTNELPSSASVALGDSTISSAQKKANARRNQPWRSLAEKS